LLLFFYPIWIPFISENIPEIFELEKRNRFLIIEISNMLKIKRITLVNPPLSSKKVYGRFSDFGSISAPTGLCYIASYIRKHGYIPFIIDSRAIPLNIDNTIKAILETKPDVIGITCKSMCLENAHKVATAVKKVLNIPIVVGGNHITALPEKTLQDFPNFDIAIIGEGEVSFLNLLHAFEQNDISNVCGIGFRSGGKIILNKSSERIKDLDVIPLPAYDLLPELKTHYWPIFNNTDRYPSFSVINSRDCHGKCRFCDRKTFGNIVARHSPEYVVSLIKNLRDHHGIRYLVFDDDNFITNKKYLYNLCDLMKSRNACIPFTCESRVDCIDKPLLNRLSEVGCKQIMFGIESGNQKILDSMNKNITIKQIEKAIRLTKQAGIKTLGYFILGFPGETLESMNDTVQFIKNLKLFDIAVQIFFPMPGSEIFDYVDRYGKFSRDWSKLGSVEDMVFVSHGLTEELLLEYMEKCYDACYKRLYQLFSLHKRVQSIRTLKLMLKFLQI